MCCLTTIIYLPSQGIPGMPDILFQHFTGFLNICLPFQCFHTHLGILQGDGKIVQGWYQTILFFFVGRNQLWESQYELNTNSHILLLPRICTLVPQQNQSKQKCKDSALVIRSNCQITLCFNDLILHTWPQNRKDACNFLLMIKLLLIHVKLEHILLSGLALFSSTVEHRDYMK